MKCKKCGKKIKLFTFPGEDSPVDMYDDCSLKDIHEYIDVTLKEMKTR